MTPLSLRTLRKSMTQRRRQLSVRERLYCAKRANLQLIKLLGYLPKGAKIALYQDDFGELPTFGIVQFCVKYGFVPYLPVVKGDTLVFAPVCVSSLGRWAVFRQTAKKRHKLGMYEPLTKPYCTIDEMAVCFCPLTVVDKHGHRMGMGGGFYDRTLAQYQGLKIGWCYHFQVVEHITPSPWDIAMDWVVHDKGVIKK